MLRRNLLSAAGLLAAASVVRPARADTQGVTATEIKIGNTMPYSGPASAIGEIGRAMAAYFAMVNDGGGIAGRKIDFVSLDDGYSPPKTLELTRRMVEQDGVAFTVMQLGTPTVAATIRYMNTKQVPQLFIGTGADKYGNHKDYPWSIGWQPSLRAEGSVYGKHILATKPDAKVAILYQNDDFGKDYVAGMRDALGARFDATVVAMASYEATDPTVDSQVVTLQSSGADTLVNASQPKFAAQAIRKISDLDWHPTHFVSGASASAGAVMVPAGAERGVGVMSAVYMKDPTDPSWADDPGMTAWRAFMARYMPGADVTDFSHVSGYTIGASTMQVLKQCGGDFSRQNIMHQAENIQRTALPTLLPGVFLETGPGNARPIRQMQLTRWTGKAFERFGEVIESAGSNV